MQKKLYKNKHYNTPGHAHELTFSCYKRIQFFNDTFACEKFLEELQAAREKFNFLLWAYVVMPNHVHILIKPVESNYSIAAITKSIKGIFAKGYLKHLVESGNTSLLQKCLVVEKGCQKQRFWQRGGGFDRNMWNPKAVYDAIHYIEANPVRAKLVFSPEEWKWSSAWARKNRMGIVPDTFNLPVKLLDPQRMRVGGV